MPIFHFNMHDDQFYPDTLGSDHENVAAAKVEAVRRLGDYLREGAERFWSGDEWTMEVTDADGLILFSLTFLAIDAPALADR